MRRVLIVIISLFNLSTLVFGQTNEINATIYVLKHDKEDSLYLVQHPNHNEYRIELARMETGTKEDTAIFVIDNMGSEALNKMVYNVFSQKTFLFPESFKIDKIGSRSKYLLKIPVVKDSSGVLVLSDFSNPVRIFSFSTKSSYYSTKAELKSIIIDDSSTVRNPLKNPFKINSKLEQGETVKLVFILNINTYKKNNIKSYLTTTNQDVYVKIKEYNIDSINEEGDFRIEYDISTSLTTDKGFPLLLRITDGKNDFYNKEIFIVYNKDYKINKTGMNISMNGGSESLKAVFKNNDIRLQFDLPEISWNNEYRYSYSINDIIDNKIVYNKSNLTTVHKTEQSLFASPMDNRAYNVVASVAKYNVTPKHRYLTLNITPSSSSGKIALNNFKMGIRYLRVKKFGYYIEFNSTLNTNKYDYKYNVITKKVEGFDDYNKFYEFTPKYYVISRDAGAGLACRLGKKIILSAGLSYYTYQFKQQIREFEYTDLSKYSLRNVLVPHYSYSRVINKLSLNYNLNKTLFGFTLSNYNKKTYRISFNMGVKI